MVLKAVCMSLRKILKNTDVRVLFQISEGPRQGGGGVREEGEREYACVLVHLHVF